MYIYNGNSIYMLLSLYFHLCLHTLIYSDRLMSVPVFFIIISLYVRHKSNKNASFISMNYTKLFLPTEILKQIANDLIFFFD